LFDRSDAIGPELRFIVRTASMPYPMRRELDLPHALTTNRRLIATLGFNGILLRRFEHRGQLGSQYWTNNAFWFADEVSNTLQTDSWLAPLDQLADVLEGRPPLSINPDRVATARISGVAADKIRFFAHAYSVASLADLAPLMRDGSYHGDLLFVLPAEVTSGLVPPVRWSSQQPLSADDSQQLSYHVEQFDANNLIVKVFNPASTGAWMSYSDVWHPSWQATVNGRRVPVYRADVAYKAVPIEPGDNVIHFHFGSTLFSMMSAIVSANAAFWLGAVVWMMSGLLRQSRHSHP
jgi:hypothetical protein